MLLLIACGNSLRQDDSAGLRLAEALAAAWEAAARPIRLVIVQQLTPELALEIARP
jgi:Ni,Fe-hydrogenase maturation factor